MAIKIEIFGKDRFIDITDRLKATGAKLPDSFTQGIFPDDLATGDDPMHFDLLDAINADETLRKTFFDGRVHPMHIIDTDGHTFDVRVLVETRYSSRNA